MLGWVKASTWRSGRFFVHTQPGSSSNEFLGGTPTQKCQTRHCKNCVLDKAKITYHSLLKDDDSNARAFAPRETQKTDGVILSEGWALKSAKKSARFNEAQKKYLEEKFNIEQRTGHKQNPEHVVKDMRFAKKPDSSRLFSSEEFLTTQQMQSFFSRLASKLRHAVEAIQVSKRHRRNKNTTKIVRLCWIKSSYNTLLRTTAWTCASWIKKAAWKHSA